MLVGVRRRVTAKDGGPSISGATQTDMLLRQVAARLAAAGLPLKNTDGGGGGGGMAGPSSPTRAERVPVKDHLKKLFQGAHQISDVLTLAQSATCTIVGVP